MENERTAEDFVFRGGALAFDLVNSEKVVRRKRADLLNTPTDMENWWHLAQAEHHLTADVHKPFTEADLVALKTLRGALRSIFDALVRQTPVDAQAMAVLNAVLRECYLQIGCDFVPVERSDSGSSPLVAAAFSALALLTQSEHTRLRKCKNEFCILMFYDSSKNGHRYWCGPDCQNRARSSAHYREMKG